MKNLHWKKKILNAERRSFGKTLNSAIGAGRSKSAPAGPFLIHPYMPNFPSFLHEKGLFNSIEQPSSFVSQGVLTHLILS